MPNQLDIEHEVGLDGTAVDSRVLSWATDLDAKTKQQAVNSARPPFIFHHVALMPDAHFGYGATVGSVIPTKGAIIPAAVGVDIGCGMLASPLKITARHLPDDLVPLHSRIAQAIPSGVGKGHHHAEVISGDGAIRRSGAGPKLPLLSPRQRAEWSEKQIVKAYNQLGTLGSGNHFIEICLDENDDVWVVLHSGSRGVGHDLANIHIDGAKGLMGRYFIDLPDPDLAYLVEGTPEFDAYIEDMLWAQGYAIRNRSRMMNLVLGQLSSLLFGEYVNLEVLRQDELTADSIDCHHNYTGREHHMGSDVWVTRKGAIRAREGDRGVIPGSMGASSYIVSGLGNKASFDSCSHGAGRRMSRGQARRELDLEGLRAAMDGKAWNEDAASLIDEDPRAYKDIDEVMAAQSDLVQIDHTLHQILNYKGT
jgi:tRNA-splicing ligase RtcB (3'-phosphate/5'-hydroxy nucleic acid ligase)